MLRGADAPLRFRPQASLHQWRWCLQFLLACRRSVNRRNAAHLLRLALHSQQILRSWREQDQLDGFAWRANGKLVIYRDQHSLHKGAAAIDDDSGQRLLDAAQCVDVEPALATLAASLHGGIYSPGDEVADCHLFCTELLRRLRASPAFHLHTGQSVSAMRTEGKRVRSVVLGRDDIAIDHLVVAAGTGSVGLLRPLGIDLPIYPLKGYSLTVGLADQDRVPQTNVTDYDNKVVYARLDDQLRVAAMVDIAGWDAGLDQQRIATLQRLAGATFPGAGDYQHARQWAGLRPATPQGTPLIGRSGFDNLWLNVGHGSLGFTLACGSADLLASVIGGSPPAVSLDGLSLPA